MAGALLKPTPQIDSPLSIIRPFQSGKKNYHKFHIASEFKIAVYYGLRTHFHLLFRLTDFFCQNEAPGPRVYLSLRIETPDFDAYVATRTKMYTH